MANPLTSSDIQREQMGFGVSPLAAPETRRAYAAAGLSPLGTQDRERMESGGGISPMAGTAEREAWKMSGYMTGLREDAPTEYGGLGDRPTGTSRRAIRMQAEWDKQKQAQMEMQQAQAEEQRRANAEIRQNTLFDLDRRNKELDLEIKDKTAAVELTNFLKTQEQANAALDVIASYDDTPEGMAQAQARISKELPFALDSDPVQKALYYKGQSAAAMQSAAASAAEANEEEAKRQAELQAEFVTYGISPELQKELLVPNLPAGVVRYDVNRAKPVIAAAKKAEEESKVTRGEEKETQKDFTSRLRKQQEALGSYQALIEGMTPEKIQKEIGVNGDPEIKKAYAAARGAANALGLDKVQSEDDLKKYKSGDRVLAPDGITVIPIP